MKSVVLPASMLFGMLVAPSVSASQLIFHFAQLSPQTPPWSQTVILPAFDPALGVLRQVRVSSSSYVYGSFGLENQSASVNSASFNAWGYVHVSLPGGSFVPASNPAFEFNGSWPSYPPGGFAAFDGVLDYRGASGLSDSFGPATGTGNPIQSIDIYQTPQLLNFLGPAGNPGSIALAVDATDETNVFPMLTPGFALVHTLATEVHLTLRYTYDPLPASFCSSAPWDGCPCNNSGSYGCANSVNGFGAMLQSSGNASIAADTLVLSGSGMPNGIVIYLQGASMSYVGQAFGDGLLCMGGPFVRLGVKTNSGGSSQYPVAGDLSISVRGGTTTPGSSTFHQAYYRDGTVYCTPASYNATNGQAILWGN